MPKEWTLISFSQKFLKVVEYHQFLEHKKPKLAITLLKYTSFCSAKTAETNKVYKTRI